MRVQDLLFSLLLSSSVVAQSNNGIGSLPQDRHYINARQATCVIGAAVKKAKTIAPENIAVLDPSGVLVAFFRMDNAFPGSIDVAIKKAKTSALFNGAPSDSFLQAAYSGGALYGLEETNGGISVIKGGLAIYDGDYLIGAIGVSGASADQDFQVAKAGVKGLCSPVANSTESGN